MLRRLFFAALPLLAACQPGPYTPPAGLVTNQRFAYSDGLHNENTDLLALDGRILLIFRGGETGQIGSDAAHINVFASDDEGQSWQPQAEISAATLGGDRDIRDPKLVVFDDRLFLYATSRLPGGHYRDLLGQAWFLRSESDDGGRTWSDPVKTFADVDDQGQETFWDMWRFTERTPTHTLYALGYDDGDDQVAMFASTDGVDWQKVSVVIDSYDDVPSEAELHFFGDDQQTAVALVRLDNQGILQDGQTAICTSQAPFASWECGRRIEQRLDGPSWLSGDVAGTHREFVVARKHLPCTFKRTALYELRGDLADPSSPIEVCEDAVLNSAGDTAYTGLALLGGDRYLVSWYSSTIPATGDVPWLEGTFTPADIWVADLDLSKAPTRRCDPPPVEEACPAAELPAGTGAAPGAGAYRFTLAPVIYPSQTIAFEATVIADGDTPGLALQPLDGETGEPTGSPWTATNVSVDGSGVLTARFDIVSLPVSAFPLLSDPLLTLHDLVLSGVATSTGFCGGFAGYAQVYGDARADRIDLQGSTFGAVPDAGDPTPVAACGG